MSARTSLRLPDTTGLGRLDGAVAVVTGGTRGIGLHTAAGLAQLGVDVVITGRDGGRGEQAVGAITAAVPGAAVRFVPTDLSTLAGVRVAAALLGQEVGRIDVLVHNAGVLLGSPVHTAEGLDLTLVVNHLAPFLLTHLLRPALHRAGARPARVLTVTSGAARVGQVDPDRLLVRDPPPAPRQSGFGSYGASKAAAALATVEWAARSAPDDTAPRHHLVDPGGADTDLVRGMSAELGSGIGAGIGRALFALFGPGRRSAATAARSSLVGAAAGGLDDHRARWIGPRGRIGDPPRRLRDPELRRAVWARTAELVGVDEGELPGTGPG